MRERIIALAMGTLAMLATGCATRGHYDTYYLAEQGDFGAALQAARSAEGGGIDGILFGTGASICRDYETVVTVLVAQGDFAGASAECAAYDRQCAVLPDSRLCFSYEMSELDGARSDTALAGALRDSAREALHARWLMIRDDYEQRPPRRPIY